MPTPRQRIEARYSVEPTGDISWMTDRKYYEVRCMACNRVLSKSTTGPEYAISAHELVVHKEDTLAGVNPNNIPLIWMNQ